MTYTIQRTTGSLGAITFSPTPSREQCNAQNGLMVMTIPGENTPFAFNIEGSQRKYTIDGVQIDTFTNLFSGSSCFIAKLKDLIDATTIDTSANVTYISSTLGTVNGFVDSVSFSFETADVKSGSSDYCKCVYSINLIETQ